MGKLPGNDESRNYFELFCSITSLMGIYYMGL